MQMNRGKELTISLFGWFYCGCALCMLFVAVAAVEALVGIHLEMEQAKPYRPFCNCYLIWSL